MLLVLEVSVMGYFVLRVGHCSPMRAVDSDAIDEKIFRRSLEIIQERGESVGHYGVRSRIVAYTQLGDPFSRYNVSLAQYHISKR